MWLGTKGAEKGAQIPLHEVTEIFAWDAMWCGGRRDAELGSAEVAGLQRPRRGRIEQFLTVQFHEEERRTGNENFSFW